MIFFSLLLLMWLIRSNLKQKLVYVLEFLKVQEYDGKSLPLSQLFVLKYISAI